MQVEIINNEYKEYIITYLFCGYRMCRTIFAKSEKDAENKLREILSIDKVISCEAL